MNDSYTASDVQVILGRALARQHNSEFSELQLVEMAQELGITPETLEQAKLDWFAEHQEAELRRAFDHKQRQGFKSQLITYVIFNTFLVGLNIVTPGSHPWSLYPLLGWGMGLALDAATTFGFIKQDEYEKKFRKWKCKHLQG